MMLCSDCKWRFPAEPFCVCDGCDYEPLSAEEQQQRAGKPTPHTNEVLWGPRKQLELEL